MTGALFEPAGDGRWVATEFARGPWDPRACHGGPVAALLARSIERVDTDTDTDTPIDWQVSRLTVELTRPVPVGRELTITTEVERPGRRVSLVASRLTDGETEVARVRALRIRNQSMPLPPETVRPLDVIPGVPDGVPTQRVTWAVGDGPAFHTHGCEHRFTEGAWDQPGPVAVWIRLRLPVVEGEVPTGVQRAAAAADFGNGVSTGLPYEGFTFINPDLTVSLVRAPVGEWIGMRTATHYGHAAASSGSGLAESELFDAEGRVGRSVQMLFIDER